ncbi:acyl-CoA dehydrogenase family protein [Skermania piniformis]|uniref:Acyl-CoA dehydrogenase n=1 Tax=Skermania pinensis TaxID=39122 RepID=A0ABX8SEK9_9ACTN|nr:acyl-CoA dehydrogenase family protein [Skermania piniformis]QXQ15771.1 acyl-CoA dehydrogenase [Skermania piniformis]
MSGADGPALDAALAELGWRELLDDAPQVAVPMVFRLLGETGTHASVLLDVLSRAGADAGPLPFAGNGWVAWDPDIDVEILPLRRVPDGVELSAEALAAGRRAIGWWLLGAGNAMLQLARSHALQRTQFGRPIASFQAVRHRLAETLVALDGAEAALTVAAEAADTDDGTPTALLAKVAAGNAGATAARHCQQVLGGVGFTAEHPLHRHVRRVLALDGLLGSSRELTREAGATIRARGSAPRLARL